MKKQSDKKPTTLERVQRLTPTLYAAAAATLCTVLISSPVTSKSPPWSGE